MNKNKLSIAVILSCSLLASQAANADSASCGSCFTSKVSQGAANIVTGFVEIPKNIVNISHDQNIFVGITWGTLRGVVHAVSRTLVGGVELISSPIATEELISPAYVWERFSEDSRYFDLNLPGYWITYGPLDNGQ
jgi:putative exosortase-associated protein (TIGR04073 family)